MEGSNRMSFFWENTIALFIVPALIILFFVSLFLFIKRRVNNNRQTKSSLVRIEEKLDLILQKLENEKNTP
ncbi:DUF4083 family protein [Paenibacillus sp. KN14-4R]|uniref:DUF4083 family protein n=1 Tax=Paenibacillus sp. KN14-4R TaxID=3445773 RepID=UPI003FA0463B